MFLGVDFLRTLSAELSNTSWLMARSSRRIASSLRWLAMADLKRSAWAAERLTETVLALTLRLQRQLPGWLGVTLPSEMEMRGNGVEMWKWEMWEMGSTLDY